MKNLEMEARINDLWNTGHSEELIYFANKCVNAYRVGCNKGRVKGICVGCIIALPITCILGYIVDHCIQPKMKNNLNRGA